MSARRKLNQAYTSGALVLAGFVGLAFQSWVAFVVGLATLIGLNVVGGNIRPAPTRR